MYSVPDGRGEPTSAALYPYLERTNRTPEACREGSRGGERSEPPPGSPLHLSRIPEGMRGFLARLRRANLDR